MAIVPGKNPWVLKRYFREDLQSIPNYYYQEVARHLKEGDVVLDAGCGSGEFGVMKVHGGPAAKIVGVDISAESLNRNLVVDERIVADLEQIPYQDNAFDLVVCETVCEHLEHPQKVFSEFSRVLKKGGYVIIRTYNIWNINNAVSALLPVRLRKLIKGQLISVPTEGTFPTYYRCNSRGRLKKLFDEVGMDEESFIAHRDSVAYWNKRAILTFFTVYEKITDLPLLNAAKMHVVGVYRKR